MAEIVLEVVHRLLLYFTMKKGEKSYVEKVRSAMMIDARGCALVMVGLAVLILAFPVQAATTEVHVLEYGLNGATIPIPLTLWGPYITGTMQDSTTINWKTENATTGTVKYATERYYKEHGDYAYERYEENGIQYVIVGCGGAPLYPLAEAKIQGYQNSFEHTLGYVKITIEGANATMGVIQVADVTEDNKAVTHIYPQNTVFETVVLSSCPSTQTKRYTNWIPTIRLRRS